MYAYCGCASSILRCAASALKLSCVSSGLSAYLNSLMPPITQLTPGCRSLANGMIVGTSEGFAKDLQLIGVGYRGSVAGKTLTMNLGFSHPVVMTIPDDVEVKVLCKPISVCFD